jgi:hypothetical protein
MRSVCEAVGSSGTHTPPRLPSFSPALSLPRLQEGTRYRIPHTIPFSHSHPHPIAIVVHAQDAVLAFGRPADSSLASVDSLRERQSVIADKDRDIVDLRASLRTRDAEIQRLHTELSALQADLRNHEVSCVGLLCWPCGARTFYSWQASWRLALSVVMCFLGAGVSTTPGHRV